jgi:hypothetical protein
MQMCGIFNDNLQSIRQGRHASRGRRAPQSINKRNDQKKNVERASGTANDTKHEYARKGKPNCRTRVR